MHETLSNLCGELEQLSASVRAVNVESRAISVATGNWSFPAVSLGDLAYRAEVLQSYIETHTTEDLGELVGILDAQVTRLRFLRANTVPQLWANAAQAVPAYTITLDELERDLHDALAPVPERQANEAASAIRDLLQRIRNIELRTNDVEPRTTSLAEMVTRIEQAHRTADRLPETLADLAEANQKISGLKVTAQGHVDALERSSSQATADASVLAERLEEAERLVTQLRTLHRVGTSTVLAGAFQNRGFWLGVSVYPWLGVLIVALAACGYVGMERMKTISALLAAPTITWPSIFMHAWLGVVAIGAPVWLGWVATKQISQRFRLAEDYKFKAAISNAYEGYRSEAASLDEDFKKRLFSSTLTRLDEVPLRLVEQETFGSPLHEAVSQRPGFWDVMLQLVSRGRAAPVTGVTSGEATKQETAKQE
ncbi:hypothetical protein [Niveibacterium sp. COAC-50]|uniref:hypothetical protein n=1 Tax=Niveibacterium sp. COAC-50 TaxID=2729384 RepID=UPI001553CC50|nr:hypothetical protein [Niveibacterium sp. COAC-50]